VLLLSRDDLSITLDMAQAIQWIHKLQNRERRLSESAKMWPVISQDKQQREAHAIEIRNLRARLTTATGVPDYAHLNDTAFLAAIEAALESGRLIPVYHAVSGHSEGTEEAPTPPPSVSAPASPDREDPEPNTFDSEHAGARQAAILTEAAEEGVPFCEVCERERARGAA
ncbi:MAG TPA: hypothetical protein VEX68_20660, partial [Bryobacteraceae bacterium]|nr:hypothetical protein [Bryobacteraceae bacterium]